MELRTKAEHYTIYRPTVQNGNSNHKSKVLPFWPRRSQSDLWIPLVLGLPTQSGLEKGMDWHVTTPHSTIHPKCSQGYLQPQNKEHPTPHQKKDRSVLSWKSHYWIYNHTKTKHSSPKRVLKTQQSIQWGWIPKTSPVNCMGPHYRIATRSTKYSPRKTTPTHPRRKKWDAQIHARTPQKRDNLHIQITLCGQLLCEEKGWKTMTSTRLPTHKQMDKEEQECIPSHSSSHWLPQWMHQVYNCRHLLGV